VPSKESFVDKYDKTIKGINDSIDSGVKAVVRTTFSVVKWIFIVIISIVVLALISSLLQSCNMNHPD
jgi:hypothetical protein